MRDEMKKEIYHSTRNRQLTATASRAVLEGLAGDGGLYISDAPAGAAFDWRELLGRNTLDMAEAILSALLPDLPDMGTLVHQGYAGKFENDELTPLVAVGDRYVLELFRGPTSAFKDVALSLLPRFITAARQVQGVEDEIVILTATSGDTGKAALEGFRDVPGTRIIVFYPEGGVSPVQQMQMTTQEGGNVCVCAVRGNFDDAQTGVKQVFSACRERTLPGVHLSSANSINIGRLAPQVVYYFKAYAELVKSGRIAVGEPVHFVVPTGNFGDILAGYYAKALGLPVGKLVCASNRNDVLTEFLTTGVYDRRRPFYKTTSPSMDILVSSNLERMLYLASGGDDAYVADLMGQLKEEGRYQVSEPVLQKLQESFDRGCCDDATAADAIGRVWRQHHYVCDPHTAVAWHVADEFMARQQDGAPVVVLSTASPYKFPVAVLEAMGEATDGDGFTLMERLHALTGVPVPKNLDSLRNKKVRHTDVIDKDDMLRYVLDKIAQPSWKE
ncbi:MAG: threonine synthase [Oscillospiraceae bacterium]|nr:threonine synthase [Oscillospiraceae bacterium]